MNKEREADVSRVLRFWFQGDRRELIITRWFPDASSDRQVSQIYIFCVFICLGPLSTLYSPLSPLLNPWLIHSSACCRRTGQQRIFRLAAASGERGVGWLGKRKQKFACTDCGARPILTAYPQVRFHYLPVWIESVHITACFTQK